MLGNKLINTNSGAAGCVSTVNNYNPFPDGGGVALYQLNGNATDVSGNYNGTATSVTYGAGEFGQAGVFNGSSSYIYNNVLNTSATKAISIWVKANDFNERWPFQQGDGQGVENFIRFYNTDDIQVRIGNVTQTFSGYSANTWYHIVAQTNTSGNANVWINGVEVGTSTAPTALTVNRTNIGVRYNTGVGYQYYFNGSIDQVRIFNRALRPYEVEALYTEEYCTPTIVPSEHFNTVTYTGDGQPTRSITNVGFQPDLVWIKQRGPSNSDHVLNDSVRGVNKKLSSNTTTAEVSPSIYGAVSSFDANGFSLAKGTDNVYPGGFEVNTTYNGATYVAWNFKAGGAAVTNTAGTITSQVSANTEAGFSVVSYTGIGSNQTVGHGLGVTPAFIITKGRSIATSWDVWHKDVPNAPYLNTNDAASGVSHHGVPNSTTFGITHPGTNASGTFINYCFAEVEGFSNFGSYAGTGASGNAVVTGFEPAFVMVKRTDASGAWSLYDNKRNPENPKDKKLVPNSSAAENVAGVTYQLNFYENGFNFNGGGADLNASGGTYIYMAFAADPTTIEPSLEDSFNTVLYTGNGGTQTIGGVFEGGGSFNGSSSKIQLPSNFNLANNSFSFSFWLANTQTSNSYPSYFICSDTSSLTTNTNLAIGREDSTGKFSFNFFNNALLSSTSVSTNGTWQHWVCTYDASTNLRKIYFNGSLDNSDTSASDFLGTSNLVLGQYRQLIWALGSIDQVRIFNTALTAAQVTELYEETDADSSVCDFPSGAGGIALYELNGNANDTCGTYNGTASNVTWLNNGVGFQPDLVWVKGRSTADNNFLNDSVRGAGYSLYSNLTSQETLPSADPAISSFDSNGFTLSSSAGVNRSGSTYVAWNWKGAELPAINSNGSIPSVVSANPAAGFSIVSYTGNGGNATIGHGLGIAPNVILFKDRTIARNWRVYHSAIGAGQNLKLNTTDAASSDAAIFQSTTPTENVFYVGASGDVNANTDNFIAYCFAEIAGFSKFGSYTGTGAAGNFQDCGFEPAFVMLKGSSFGTNWNIFDNKRGASKILNLNLSQAEATYPPDNTYVISENGFSFTGYYGNDSGQTFIYMAFANQF